MRHGWFWSAPARAAFRLVVALIAGGLVAACSRTGEGSSSPADGKSDPSFSVVATTGMIADVARNVAGDRVVVTALMGEGVDPHMYKASPGDARLLTSADLVLYNGLHLEGRMADVLVKMAQRHPTVQVTDTIPEDRLREPPEFQGHFDPHVWFDVSLWMLATERTRDALIEIDPAGKPGYNERSAAYLEELARLDAWARERIATIPTDRRVLVTAHDAFGYFGRAYGMEVRAIQGISTDSEASMRDINSLVDMLVKDRIPAVFVESSVPRKTIEALVEGARARGHNVKIGGELFSDAMGPAGTPEGTYIGMVRHNVDVIVAALAEPAQ